MRPVPSLRSSTSPQVSAAASERLSSPSRIVEARAMSTLPRLRAAVLDSRRRPDGPRRGVRAVARMAARASPVNAAAWRVVRPVSARLCD